jgi:hypothetical protein
MELLVRLVRVEPDAELRGVSRVLCWTDVLLVVREVAFGT